jgi:hypothetical protein
VRRECFDYYHAGAHGEPCADAAEGGINYQAAM